MNTLHSIKITDTYNDLSTLKDLYNRNFPFDERIPFPRLYQQLSDIKIMHAWFDNNQFIGMTVIFLHKDLVYLAYLVIAEEKRNQGYGSFILQKLHKQYPTSRIVIDIEEVKTDAADYQTRLQRRNFYYRNHFQSTGVFYHFYNVDYELLCLGGPLTAAEYHDLILKHWGPIANTAVYRTN